MKLVSLRENYSFSSFSPFSGTILFKFVFTPNLLPVEVFCYSSIQV